MHRLVSPLLTVFVLFLLFSPAQAAPAYQCGLPVATETGTLLSGEGKLNTRPIELAGGAYTVRWSAAMSNQFGGNVILTLKPTTGGVLGQQLLVNMVLNREKPDANGETQVYGLKAGTYYLEVTAPGPWEVSITPQ